MDQISSTPISSLPDIGLNNMQQMHNSGNGGGGSGQMNQYSNSTTSYIPLNTHKNPYTDSAMPNEFMPPPMNPNMGNKHGNMPPSIDELQKYALPSRDIPRNTDMLTHDEQIIPSYIPKHENARRDYIKEGGSGGSGDENGSKKKNKRVHFAEDSLNDMQEPLIFSLLFFIFHLPFVTNLFCKYLGSFGFAGIDGNINVAGIMLKSILFGITVYAYKYIMAD
jgi:hypothetical protein